MDGLLAPEEAARARWEPRPPRTVRNIYDQALIASDATNPQQPYTRPHCGGLLAHRCVLIVWEQPSFAEGLLRLASKPVLVVAIAG